MDDATLPAIRHDAFISYVHAQPDASFAHWLHRALEHYRTPRPLAAREGVRPRLARVFIDRAELSASPSLRAALEQELEASRAQIVVCSPRAAASRWVEAEVAHFRRLGRPVLAVLLEGTPETAFPQALREGGVEPLAVDLAKMPGRLRRTRWRHALLQLLPPLIGCRFDELVLRERARTRRRRLAVAGAGAALGVVAAVGGYRAVDDSIAELAVHAQAAWTEDPSRSVLLAGIALERSERFLGIGRRTAEEAVVQALARSRLRLQSDRQAFGVRGLAWSEADTIVAGGSSGRVWALSRQDGRQLSSVQPGIGVHRIVPDAQDPPQRYAVADASRVVALWTPATGDVQRLPAGSEVITLPASDVSWCHDGVHLALSSGVDEILVVDLRPGQAVRRVRHPEWGYVNAVAYNADCSLLAVGAMSGVYLWHAASGKVSLLGTHAPDAMNVGQQRAEGALRVAWQPGGRRLASAGHDRTVRIWTPGSDEAPTVLGQHTDRVQDVAWSPDGSRLATASADGTLRIWSRPPDSSLPKAETIATGQPDCWSVAWNPMGTEVASGCDDRVRVWRVAGGSEMVTLGGVNSALRREDDGTLSFGAHPLSSAQLLELARVRAVRALEPEECTKYLRGAVCPSR